MGDPDDKSKKAFNRRNFIVKKLRTDSQYRKKIHKDVKQQEKDNRWSKVKVYEEATAASSDEDTEREHTVSSRYSNEFPFYDEYDLR